MRILAIDPGPTESAYVTLTNGIPDGHKKVPNSQLLDLIDYEHDPEKCSGFEAVVIEQIASMGMAVGAEVFETCVWTGRFWEAAERANVHVYRLKRIDVKLHLCGQARAKDPNVRQALIDRFGGASAKGTKKKPGPLYGITRDCWAALAVAVTWADTKGSEAKP